MFLESELFYKGVKPALSYGLSVSRIGSAAQSLSMKSIASTLKLELAQFREVEVFSQFDYELDFSTQLQITRGESLVECLKQDQYYPFPLIYQLLIISFAVNGFFDQIGSLNIYWLKQILFYFISLLLIFNLNLLFFKKNIFNKYFVFYFSSFTSDKLLKISYNYFNTYNSFLAASIFFFLPKWLTKKNNFVYKNYPNWVTYFYFQNLSIKINYFFYYTNLFFYFSTLSFSVTQKLINPISNIHFYLRKSL